MGRRRVARHPARRLGGGALLLHPAAAAAPGADARRIRRARHSRRRPARHPERLPDLDRHEPRAHRQPRLPRGRMAARACPLQAVPPRAPAVPALGLRDALRRPRAPAAGRGLRGRPRRLPRHRRRALRRQRRGVPGPVLETVFPKRRAKSGWPTACGPTGSSPPSRRLRAGRMGNRGSRAATPCWRSTSPAGEPLAFDACREIVPQGRRLLSRAISPTFPRARRDLRQLALLSRLLRHPPRNLQHRPLPARFLRVPVPGATADQTYERAFSPHGRSVTRGQLATNAAAAALRPFAEGHVPVNAGALFPAPLGNWGSSP